MGMRRLHGDGSLYKGGKPVMQTEDKNRDKKPDVWVYFNEKGEKEKVEIDSRLKGEKLIRGNTIRPAF